MKIIIAKNENEFDTLAAWEIITQILCKDNSVIGLSTGQTTIGMHKIVSEIYKAYPFNASRVTIFNVDELTNLSREYSGSCYSIIKKQIIEKLNISECNFIMPPTISEDFKQECSKFEDELIKRGGVDLQMLGIGKNGHIGINQPGTPFESETWVSPMDEEFEERVRRETGVSRSHELGGLTRGIKNIMHSRRIVLVAKGESKADIISKALLEPVTTDIPASILQLHPNCTFLLDAKAAKNIINKL